jgi:hypothetical protein
MADDKATSTATATAAAAGVTKTEFESLEAKVDRLLEATHVAGGQAVKAKLDEPQTVADQVKAELAARDQAAKAAERDAEFTTVKEELAKLKETPPAAVVRRVTRVMFGNPG